VNSSLLGQFQALGGKVPYLVACFADRIVLIPYQMIGTLLSVVGRNTLERAAEPLGDLADEVVDGIGGLFAQVIEAAAEPVADRIGDFHREEGARKTEGLARELVPAGPDGLEKRFRFASAVPVSDIQGVGFAVRRTRVFLTVRCTTYKWYGLLRTAELEIPRVEAAKCVAALTATLPGRVHNISSVRQGL
jgi:hypothetical protein